MFFTISLILAGVLAYMNRDWLKTNVPTAWTWVTGWFKKTPPPAPPAPPVV